MLPEVRIQRLEAAAGENVLPRGRGRPRMVPLSQVVQLIQPKNEATLNPINLIEYTDETAERHVFAGGCVHSGKHSVFNPKDLMG